MSKFTEQELLTHPLMKKVQADLAETRRVQEQEALAQEMEAARIRAEEGKYLHAHVMELLDKYEVNRSALHQDVGRVWIAVQDYQRLTRQLPPGFSENTFNEINLVSLKPSARWSSGYSTTRAAIMGWFSSAGQRWE